MRSLLPRSTSTLVPSTGYIVQAIAVLAATTKPLDQAIQPGTFTVLDGTIITTDRLTDMTFYCAHKHRFGVNIQALLSLSGDVLWTSPGLPGSVHDLTAARRHHILTTLTTLNVTALADTGYIGAGHGVIHPRRRTLADRQQRRVDAANARLRCQDEHGFAQLKCWKILSRHPGYPQRIRTIASTTSTLL